MSTWRQRFHAMLPAAELGLVFVAALLPLLRLSRRQLPLHADTIRHLLLAGDCLENGICHLRLATDGGTSTLGPYHGSVFLDYVLAVQWLGGGIAACLIGVGVLLAAASALLYWIARSQFGRLWAAAITYVWSSQFGEAMHTLWNPSLIPLPAIMLLGASVCFLQTRKPMFIWLAAVTIGVGTALHLAFAAGVLTLGFLVLTLPRGRRATGAIAAAALLMVSLQLVSPTMFVRMDWRVVDAVSSPLVIAVAIAGAVLWASAIALLRARVQPLTAMIFAVNLPVVVLAVLLGAEARYYEGLLPGALLAPPILLSVLARRYSIRSRWRIFHPRRWHRAAAVLLLALLLQGRGDAGTRDDAHFTHDDAQTVSAALAARGTAQYRDIFRHLRGGSDAWSLLNGLALYLPDSAPAATDRTRESTDDTMVFAVTDDRGPLPQGPGWDLLNGRETRPLLVHTITPWLEWDQFDVCLIPSIESKCELRTVRYDLGLDPNSGPVLLAHRALPAVLAMAAASENVRRLGIRVRIEVPAGAPDRWIIVPQVGSLGTDVCIGAVMQARGVLVDAPLPSARVRVKGGPAAQHGVLVFAWDYGSETCSPYAYHGMPPPVLELAIEDLAPLAAAVDRAETGGTAAALPAAFSTDLVDAPATPSHDPMLRLPREPTVSSLYVQTITAMMALGTLAALAGIGWCLRRDHLDTK